MTIDKNWFLQRSNNEVNGIFMFDIIKELFKKHLSEYLSFYKEILQISTPITFCAGATSVEGYSLFSNRRCWGRCVEDNIIYEGTINDYNVELEDILRPFYALMWEECGLDYPY